MIDIHSHILYDLDDGAKDEEMTMAMLKMAELDGITTMVATPHYISGANQYKVQKLKDRYDEVVALIKRNEIKIELLLGNEIFIDEYSVEAIEGKQCCSLGETSYVLVELPRSGDSICAEKALYHLIHRGYTPILAHPERYMTIQEDPNGVMKYIEMGCMIQINGTSIMGIGGKKAKETAKQLLENHMGHVIASDCHSNQRRSPQLSSAYRQVIEWIGKERAEKLFYHNPKLMLQDKEIDIEEPLYINQRTGFLHRLRHYIELAK